MQFCCQIGGMKALVHGAQRRLALAARQPERVAQLVDIIGFEGSRHDANHRIDREHLVGVDFTAAKQRDGTAPGVTHEQVDRPGQSARDRFQVAQTAGQRHWPQHRSAVAMAALIVREHLKARLHPFGKAPPGTARARNPMDA